MESFKQNKKQEQISPHGGECSKPSNIRIPIKIRFLINGKKEAIYRYRVRAPFHPRLIAEKEGGL